MKILSVDPGAKRAGWAILSEGSSTDAGEIKYHASGVLGVERGSNPQEPYQKYRLRLIDYWVNQAIDLFATYLPDRLVSEIVPAVGGGNFVAATQSMLANVAVTTMEAMAYFHGHIVEQVAASTAKRKVAGNGHATKVKVRDGVLRRLPELEPRRPDWTGKGAIFEETDALAIGLAYFT